jgi:hypothetical protein
MITYKRLYNYANIIEYLHNNVEHCTRRFRGAEIQPKYLSTTAQRVLYEGKTGLWAVEMRGPHMYVSCKDPELELLIRLKF